MTHTYFIVYTVVCTQYMITYSKMCIGVMFLYFHALVITTVFCVFNSNGVENNYEFL